MIDYVSLYAKRLAEDASLFRQQKMLIDSQIKASRQIFANRFGTGAEFKRNARRYLREMGLI
ncbi:MAG: hypothetical protein ABH879_00785 [archaeon]